MEPAEVANVNRQIKHIELDRRIEVLDQQISELKAEKSKLSRKKIEMNRRDKEGERLRKLYGEKKNERMVYCECCEIYISKYNKTHAVTATHLHNLEVFPQ